MPGLAARCMMVSNLRVSSSLRDPMLVRRKVKFGRFLERSGSRFSILVCLGYILSRESTPMTL